MPVSHIQEYLPSSPLRALVQCYWSGDFNTRSLRDFSQSVIPNGFVELIIHLTDDHCDLYKGHEWGHSPNHTLLGIYTKPYSVRFRKNVKVFGVRFNPEGFNIAFGALPSEFLGTFEDMESVGGKAIADFCDSVRECASVALRIRHTEEFLAKKLCNPRVASDYVSKAAVMIRQNELIRMTELYELIPISPRQLQREFKSRIGISPKAYMRLARMNAIQRYLNVNGNPDLTALSYDHGFSDQSHFIREFRALTGTRPGRFQKERSRFIVNPGA